MQFEELSFDEFEEAFKSLKRNRAGTALECFKSYLSNRKQYHPPKIYSKAV